jgi:hypothetical protein
MASTQTWLRLSRLLPRLEGKRVLHESLTENYPELTLARSKSRSATGLMIGRRRWFITLLGSVAVSPKALRDSSREATERRASTPQRVHSVALP